MPIELDIVGQGQTDRLLATIAGHSLQAVVRYHGQVPNNRVVPMMREASAVVVPSRHAYPEGLPLTIYEALLARTPIIASDHPMFRPYLRHRDNALIFRAGRPKELSTLVQLLLDDADLYTRLSTTAVATWEEMQVPVKWGELLMRWVQDGPADRSWLNASSLAHVHPH